MLLEQEIKIIQSILSVYLMNPVSYDYGSVLISNEYGVSGCTFYTKKFSLKKEYLTISCEYNELFFDFKVPFLKKLMRIYGNDFKILQEIVDKIDERVDFDNHMRVYFTWGYKIFKHGFIVPTKKLEKITKIDSLHLIENGIEF